MTNAQQEIQAVIDDLSAKIVDLETRTAALKDLRYYARNVLSKYEPNQFVGMTAQEAIEFEDKELPSSGIYADESSYTAEDKAAALVHDAELDHGEWVELEKLECPTDLHDVVVCKYEDGQKSHWPVEAHQIDWSGEVGYRVTHWKSVKEPKLDPALVELCSNTTIHADEDGWIPHDLEGCPIENLDAELQVMNRKTGFVSTLYARHVEWGYGFRKESYPNLVVSKWRYAN